MGRVCSLLLPVSVLGRGCAAAVEDAALRLCVQVPCVRVSVGRVLNSAVTGWERKSAFCSLFLMERMEAFQWLGEKCVNVFSKLF